MCAGPSNSGKAKHEGATAYDNTYARATEGRSGGEETRYKDFMHPLLRDLPYLIVLICLQDPRQVSAQSFNEEENADVLTAGLKCSITRLAAMPETEILQLAEEPEIYPKSLQDSIPTTKGCH